MSFIPTWPIAAGALLVGMVFGAGTDHLVMNGHVRKAEKATADLRAAVDKADKLRNEAADKDEQLQRTTEQQTIESLTRTLQAKENEKARIALERDVAVAGLRDRPTRGTPATSTAGPSAPACKGATGAELSREDGEFLVGEAARADATRAALNQCYAQYDTVRDNFNRPVPPAE